MLNEVLLGHNVDKRVDAPFSCGSVMNPPVAILGLSYTTIGQCVSGMIRVCAKVLPVTWMSHGKLK